MVEMKSTTLENMGISMSLAIFLLIVLPILIYLLLFLASVLTKSNKASDMYLGISKVVVVIGVMELVLAISLILEAGKTINIEDEIKTYSFKDSSYNGSYDSLYLKLENVDKDVVVFLNDGVFTEDKERKLNDIINRGAKIDKNILDYFREKGELGEEVNYNYRGGGYRINGEGMISNVKFEEFLEELEKTTTIK